MCSLHGLRLHVALQMIRGMIGRHSLLFPRFFLESPFLRSITGSRSMDFPLERSGMANGGTTTSAERVLIPQTGEDFDLSAMRKPYNPALNAFLEEDLVAREPFAQFKDWFDQICSCPTIKEPNAVALATATRDGKPSCRMVLLKGFGKHGFRFFSNYESRKGCELADNPQATLMFYWDGPNRSVRIEGKVEKITEDESSAYFHSRPLGSQVAASVSRQSTVVPSRNFLAEKADALLANVQNNPEKLTKPAFWGGYNLIPDKVEFWQGQTNRLHDRIRFRRLTPGEVLDPSVTHVGDDGWVFERLSP